MCATPLRVLVLSILLSGCVASPQVATPFVLADDSATARLMANQTVRQKAAICPVPIGCWVEGYKPGEIELYLGEDHKDHFARIGAYRVTSDGRVWVNADPSLLEDNWVVVR